jgi:hypothetical protein
MDLVHFTPGALDHDSARRPGATAIMPLANGKGEIEISCLYLAPGGRVSVPPSGHSQLILTVNGKRLPSFQLASAQEFMLAWGCSCILARLVSWTLNRVR